MKLWTAHEKPHRAPLLIKEGFALGAMLFAPAWFAASGAWIAAGLSLAVFAAILAMAPVPASLILAAGAAVLLGLTGRDLVRWTLTLNGYVETHVVSARRIDDARMRLLTARPDLAETEMAAEARRR